MGKLRQDEYFTVADIVDPALNTQIGNLIKGHSVADYWLLYVKNTGVSGTTPSITLKVQGSVLPATDWVDLKTFTAITAAQYQDDGATPASPAPYRYSVLRLVASAKSGTTPALTGVTAGIYYAGND